MIFQHTWEMVLSGRKTRTCRVVKGGDAVTTNGNGEIVQVLSYKNGRSRVRWQVGDTYAVQPQRTAKAIARIRITAIEKRDVRELTDVEIAEEGFDTRAAFLYTWCQMHDKKAVKACEMSPEGYYRASLLDARPSEYYQAWCLKFELAEG